MTAGSAKPNAAAVLDTAAALLSYQIGESLGYFYKVGATASTVHALSGELHLSSTGYGLLSVPNGLVRGVFQALDEVGAELPKGPDGRPFNAHITVFRPEELEHIGGDKVVTEWGKHFHYTLGPVQELDVERGDISMTWIIEIQSRELERLRKSYGLAATPSRGTQPFHCTVAVRRHGVLQRGNTISKAAALTRDKLREMADRVTKEPSKERIDAHNYSMGHISFKGLPITIENPVGSVRSGVTKDGKKWSTTLRDHYGYFKRTEGKDGDHVDVFVRHDDHEHGLDSEIVFVVNQFVGGKFDEHKCVVGCNSERQARETYLRNYQDGWDGLHSIKAMTIDQFKDWLEHGDTTKKAAKAFHPDLCPECDRPVSGRCRCMIGNRSCEAGHDWWVCYKHKKKFTGPGHGVELTESPRGRKPGEEPPCLCPKADTEKSAAEVNVTIIRLAKQLPEELFEAEQKDDDEEERMPKDRPYTIAVDFDGTIFEPVVPFDAKKVGKPIQKTIDFMRECRLRGARLLIHTVRGDLDPVKDALFEHHVPYDHINENPDQPEGSSDKLYADTYVDDRAENIEDINADDEETKLDLYDAIEKHQERRTKKRADILGSEGVAGVLSNPLYAGAAGTGVGLLAGLPYLASNYQPGKRLKTVGTYLGGAGALGLAAAGVSKLMSGTSDGTGDEVERMPDYEPRLTEYNRVRDAFIGMGNTPERADEILGHLHPDHDPHNVWGGALPASITGTEGRQIRLIRHGTPLDAPYR